MYPRRQSRSLGMGMLGLFAGALLGHQFFHRVDQAFGHDLRPGHARSYLEDPMYSNVQSDSARAYIRLRQSRQRISESINQNERSALRKDKQESRSQNEQSALHKDQHQQELRKQDPGQDTAVAVKSMAKEESFGNSDSSQDTFHTMLTSNGSPYLNFQTRIMYSTYLLAQKMPGGEKMVAFTRILHRSLDDELMDEIPTWRAEPLDPRCDIWCEFPVGNRPRAVRDFFAASDKDPSLIKAPWILMLEGDYVWMKPLKVPMANSIEKSWLFPYEYIQPQMSGLGTIMRQMFPEEAGNLTDIPNSGPSPVLMRIDEWKRVGKDWERLAKHVDEVQPTREILGWVREMYAFSIAVALEKIPFELVPHPHSPFMAQPPHDTTLGNAAFCHYTWGTLVEDKISREKIWLFDKRTYVAHDDALKVPFIPLPPPWKPGAILHDGMPWSEDLWNVTNEMLKVMNKGIASLPDLRYRKIQPRTLDP